MFLLWNYAILFLDCYLTCDFCLHIAEEMAKPEEVANNHRVVVILNPWGDLKPSSKATN